MLSLIFFTSCNGYSIFHRVRRKSGGLCFFASSALMLVSALSFIILAEDGIADWAKDSQKRNKLEAEAEKKRFGENSERCQN